MLWAWMRHRTGPFNSLDSSIHCTMPPSHVRCAVSREAQRHQSTWKVGKAKQPKWWRSNANSQTFHTVEIPEIFWNPWPSFKRKCVLKMWDTRLNCKPSLYTKEMSGYPNPDIRKYRYTPRVGPQTVHRSVLVCFLQNTTILTRWPPEFSRTAAACGRFSCPAAKANHIASARCKAPRAPFSTSLHWDRGTEKPNVVIFGDCWAGFLQHPSDLKALGLSD